MYLSELLKGLAKIEAAQECDIQGLSQDTRTLKSGDLFFACAGTQDDGRKYIAEAIKKGAHAILVEADSEQKLKIKTNVPIIYLSNLNAHIGLIAARFYDYPSRDMKIIGVTGTNGKTSCTHFIAASLKMLNIPCGIIGTLGNGLYGELKHSIHTTPDAIALQKILSDFKKQGIKYVAMEVSSHAIAQDRINGLEFFIALFTNLTRDHLDYHGDMENYARVKRSLFTRKGLQHCILNADDRYGRSWLKELTGDISVYAYSLESPVADIHSIPITYLHHANFDNNGITASVHTPWGDGLLHNSHIVGKFNLSNLLAVLTVLGILDIPLEIILACLSQLQGVPGRMEAIKTHEKPLVIVDYSHTPDALEQALLAIRDHCHGKLWCVFGCGGDRDRGKRPLMGKIAEQHADQLVITDDNPRSEEPKKIIADIMGGIENKAKTVIEHDRRRAIAHAISCAQSDDVILIAGKGHETYQIIGKERLPFSDVVEAQLILNS
jgi:UDP-N-acetylmuramoyl-L-alanyl-D-glutamate--2,6-diaminopimelate ligase